MIVHSDGEVGLSDAYMSAVDWYKEQRMYNVDGSTFAEWLNQPMMHEMSDAYHKLPEACKDCSYRDICRGGMLEHRFSTQRHFDNKSLYCAALVAIYEHVEKTLIEGGYPVRISLPPVTTAEMVSL